MSTGSTGLHVIVGLGATGYSCVRYLTQKNIPVAVTDTRQHPPYLAELKAHFPDVPVSAGGLDEALFAQAEKLVVSPGISLATPQIAFQLAKGTPVIGDIELFVVAAGAPMIAITGTNAKSTVTTLVGKMAEAAGIQVCVGGNLGTPALDLLSSPPPALFVLELSSFQLETTFSLQAAVATVLNISPDHLDRHADMDAYTQAKRRIYSQCQVAVCNRDDAMTDCRDDRVTQKIYFTLNPPGPDEFGLLTIQGDLFLAHGDHALMAVSDLPILGRHYQANALAALAIGQGYGLPMVAMLETLRTFKGLPHRCQLVRERLGVRWYNDSKGTNVGATVAAILGLGQVISGKLILIAGGVGKNADFSPLMPAVKKYVKTLILIGEAANELAAMMKEVTEIQFAATLEEAVSIADQKALAGDSVLLSPACASFDMFKNFEHRGEVFAEAVRAL